MLPVSILFLVIFLDRTTPHILSQSITHFWARMGRQAFNTGNPQLAIPLLGMAAVEHDLSPSDWTLLGDAFQAVGDPSSALLAWQEAGDTPETLERRLQAHRLLQDYPSVISDLHLLLLYYPQDASHLYLLGIYLAATRPDQAILYLNQSASLSSSYAAARALASRIQIARGLSQPAYVLLEAGRGLMDVNEWELAAEAFRNALLLRPDYSEAWAFLGEALQHIQVPTGKAFSSNGLSELEFAIQLDPESISANLFLSLYWRRQGKWSSAMDVLENLAKRHPDNPVIQVEIGNTLAESGDARTALSYFLRATQLAPGESEYWMALAYFSLSTHYQPRAVALPAARRLLMLTPEDPKALDLMGRILFLLEDPLSAERYFRRALQSDNNFAPAHLHLGQIYLQRGANLAAQQEFEYTIALDPTSNEGELAQGLLQINFK